MMKNVNRYLLLTKFMIFIFIAVGISTIIPPIQDLDLLILKKIISYRTHNATIFFKFITSFGSPMFFFPGTIALCIIYFFWQDVLGPLTVSLTMGSTYAIMEGLKQLFNRPRPIFDPLEPAKGFSFPSGHAMLCTVFLGLLAFWLIRKVCPRHRLLVIGIISALLLLIGLSRLYLGLHYPTDVVGGYTAGLAILSFSLAFMKKIKT